MLLGSFGNVQWRKVDPKDATHAVTVIGCWAFSVMLHLQSGLVSAVSKCPLPNMRLPYERLPFKLNSKKELLHPTIRPL